LRDEDERDPVRDFVSACAESPVEPSRDLYEEAGTAGFNSFVFAVDDGLDAAFDADDIRALSRRSIMLRALPPSSIALLICGATIFAAVLPAPPPLIFSATGSFSTIVGIEDADAAGFDTADFHGVIGRDGVDCGGDGAGGNDALLNTTVDCVDIGLGAGVFANPALPPSCPDRFSGGGSGNARFISFADA